MSGTDPRRGDDSGYSRTAAIDSGEAAGSGALTANDHGRLPESPRRVLVQLIKGPYMQRDKDPRLWPTLIADEHVIRERLGDLFLELVLEPDAGVAFVRNMRSEEADLPRVIRSTPLTLLDTALVLFLREQLLRAEASATRVFVGRDELDDQLAVYRAITDYDPATFSRRVNASIEKMKNASVLLSTSESGRFEISPVLAMVFNADEVLAVTHELRSLVARTSGAVAAENLAPEDLAPEDLAPEDLAPEDLAPEDLATGDLATGEAG